MFARTQSQPSSHAGSGKGRKQKQGRRTNKVDPGGGGEGQHTPSHSPSLVDDMEDVSELTSHASLDTAAGHMTSHDAI